jgi:hypothetical protein
VKRGPHFSREKLYNYCHTVSAGYTSDTQFLDTHLESDRRIVYSYDPHGLFHDPTETWCLLHVRVTSVEMWYCLMRMGPSIVNLR